MPAASQNRSTGTGSKIESHFELKSSWLPKSVFEFIHQNYSIAVATAIEGVEDPKEQEVTAAAAVAAAVTTRSDILPWLSSGRRMAGVEPVLPTENGR